MEYPSVAVIIVNWNGKEDTIECLNSLQKIEYPNYKIFIVDNGSTDGSQSIMRKLSYITFIENNRNLGYAGGVNVGIEYSLRRGMDYIFLLNNDCVVDKNFLGELIKVTEDKKNIGIAGPIMYFYNEQNKMQEFGGYITLFNIIKGEIKPEYGLVDTGQFGIRYVDYIAGGACLIKRSVIEKIGKFDSSYFLYWEETDFDMRAKRAGFKLVVVPTSKVWHKISSTMKKNSSLVMYYITRNRIRFIKKYFSRTNYYFFLTTIFLKDLPVNIAYLVFKDRNLSRFKLYLRAIKDGIIGVGGQLQC